MIPAFRTDGLLPIGRHAASPDEIEQRFVDAFPMSIKRGPLYADWRRRRQEIAALAAIEMEWLNGSYTTAKPNPNDIDAVTFVHVDEWERLSFADRQKLAELAMLNSKALFGCDGYLVIVFPRNHPFENVYLRDLGYWERQWSFTRPEPTTGLETEKGFVDVRGAP